MRGSRARAGAQGLCGGAHGGGLVGAGGRGREVCKLCACGATLRQKPAHHLAIPLRVCEVVWRHWQSFLVGEGGIAQRLDMCAHMRACVDERVRCVRVSEALPGCGLGLAAGPARCGPGSACCALPAGLVSIQT